MLKLNVNIGQLKRGEIYKGWEILELIAKGIIKNNIVIRETQSGHLYFFKKTGFKRLLPEYNNQKFLQYRNLNLKYEIETVGNKYDSIKQN